MARDADRTEFERALRALQADVTAAGAFMEVDASVRLEYARRIKQMSQDLTRQAETGRITWRAAAKEAVDVRNLIMDMQRSRSTPVGRALAEHFKRQGKTLNQLIAEKVVATHGAGAKWSDLSPVQQNRVHAKIVASAGKSNPRVSAKLRSLSRAGRGLLVLSLALSVYSVATAEDTAAAAKREVGVTGAGILGAAGGGAVAGLACGPGAPVCVAVGAFVGGAAAAFGVDLFFEESSPSN